MHETAIELGQIDSLAALLREPVGNAIVALRENPDDPRSSSRAISDSDARTIFNPPNPGSFDFIEAAQMATMRTNQMLEALATSEWQLDLATARQAIDVATNAPVELSVSDRIQSLVRAILPLQHLVRLHGQGDVVVRHLIDGPMQQIAHGLASQSRLVDALLRRSA